MQLDVWRQQQQHRRKSWPSSVARGAGVIWCSDDVILTMVTSTGRCVWQALELPVMDQQSLCCCCGVAQRLPLELQA